MAQPNSSLTPEKRLLELIEEPESHKKDSGAIGPGISGRNALDGITEIWSTLKENARGISDRFKNLLDIKGLNKILKLVVLGLIIIFFVNFIMGLKGLNEDFVKSIEFPEKPALDIAILKTGSETDTEEKGWDLGKMFIPYGKRQEESERIKKEQSARLVEATKELKLTGISYDPMNSKNAFCMIEDIAKGITTFLREGDPIGALKVGKIYEDYVVLETDNESIEIR